MQHFKRSFQLWEFRVSHDQLLLRSPKDKTNLKNVDMAFVGVEYLELPTLVRELTVGDPGDDDIRRVENVLGKAVPRNRIFVIKDHERRYLVVAAAMKIFENDLDLFESSLEKF